VLAEAIRPLLPAIRKGMDDSAYALDQMGEVAGDGTTAEARRVIELFLNRQRRIYPDSGAGGTDGEDAILAELLPEQQGIYVEVGAWRPKEQNNTWQFFQRGWRGLLVEPVPEAWAALLHERWPDRLCPYAVDTQTGQAVFEVVGPISGIYRPDHPPTPESVLLVADTMRLADILDCVPDIRDNCRLCSIDVEGHEAAVVASTDWTVFRPTVLIIEHVHGEEGWWPRLEAEGYKEHARTNKNIVLLRKDSAE
jgi:hypothetical protein